MAARKSKRKFDVRPDTVDFHDKMYVPTLVEVPIRIPLEKYREVKVSILDQGEEGACSGFGLATVVHYLLRTRDVEPDKTEVSPRMLYEMARRYDEWPGEKYEGSSARGGMKGWHKHGACSAAVWPYDPKQADSRLTDARVADAARRPLGAYFRVNHKDLVAMHSAITEVGVLYATATCHTGWDEVGRDGKIPYRPGDEGAHAFALVAYDEEGFWLQNSWADDWGLKGFGHISYADWLANGMDIWVARLGVPVKLPATDSSAKGRSVYISQTAGISHREVRPHVISIGNDGRLRDWGTYGTSRDDVEQIIQHDLVQTTAGWNRKRVLLYAHGGLVGETNAIQRVAEYLPALTGAQVYPLAFVWKTDFWTTVSNILQDAGRQRRPEGFVDAAKDFMLDRLDDMLEPLARTIGGKALWEEMKENALDATISNEGGARYAVGLLDPLIDPHKIELHLVGHSAGSIFLGPIVQLLTTPKGQVIKSGPLAGQQGLGRTIASCALWAPACTTELFKDAYLPAIQSGALRRFRLFTLTDAAEQDDDCASIYHKSLLYLVAHAFEPRPRVPLIQPEGTPILGMEKFILADPKLRRVFKTVDPGNGAADAVAWIRSPNKQPLGSPSASQAMHHGDFDDDRATVQATLALITSAQAARKAEFVFARSSASLRDRRKMLG